MNLHEQFCSKKAIIGRDKNPKVKNMNPIIPTLPLHFFPTSSVARTIAQVPIGARPNPLKNRNRVYIHILVEAAVRTPVRDIIRQDRTNKFFRPRDESAKVASKNPPARQPRKKDDAGRPVMMEPAHSRDHSEMMDVVPGEFQDQAFLGSWHMSSPAVELQGKLLLQVHLGCASVKTAMKVCCASKNHANERIMDWRNWVRTEWVMQCSIVSLRERRGGGGVAGSLCESRGFGSAILKECVDTWNDGGEDDK